MCILPKIIYRVNAISIKIPMEFFTEIEQTILKFVWNHRRQIESNLEKEQQIGGNKVPNVKLYYKSYNHENSMVLA